ncbi:MAG: class I SAM-dependent methyltransferase [Candidatus Aquicultorales bacterium]
MKPIERAVVKTVASRRYSAETFRSMALGLNIPAEASVLEIGCGPAAALFKAVELVHPALAVGVDVDEKMLSFAKMEAARKRLPFVKLIQAPAESLPLGPRTMDVVIAFLVLHHVDDWKWSIREVARVLKPGGHFLSREAFTPRRATWFGRVVHRIPRDLTVPRFLAHCERLGLVPEEGAHTSMHGQWVFVKK